MSLLTIENVKKHFGAVEVLAGASLRIDPGEKLGLVGRNGAGKSTLLRIIEGLEAPDWGSATLRKSARLSHVVQRPDFAAGETVRTWVERGLEETRRAAHELETLAGRMAEAEGDELARIMREHDALSEQVERDGGWEIERRVETVLGGIGLAAELWDREARTLSGGEQSRTALARALVAGGDLLLLDEPTNHLDLVGIEWLEGWIASLACAVLVVSHDRRLLTNAVEAILEMERGQIVRYPGRWPKYLELKQERYTAESRAFEQQQDLIRKEEQFIKKHIGSQRTAEAKGRQRRLANLVRLRRPFHDVRQPVIRPAKIERGGELVLEADGLAAGYGDKRLFEGADLRVGRGDRIGVVGPNGAGKTTLLKILAGRMQPLAGAVHAGHRARCGFYDQDTSELRDDSTPHGEIRRNRPEMTDQEIRDHLARFLFRGNDVDVSVAALSGGERARLCLARLMLTEPSWLALDEPTNHLDLASRTALEEMLGDFPGAILCVSHDREFLDGLATRIVEVGAGTVRSFTGNYTTWRQARADETAQAREVAARSRPKPAQTRQATAAARTQAKDAAGSSGRVRNPWAFAKLEEEIMTLETEKEALEAACATEEVYRDTTRLKEAQVRLAEIERELEDANERWENWETA